MPTTTTTTQQSPPKKRWKVRLLVGQFVQNGRRIPGGRDGIGDNEYEHEIFNPGDVFESDIDLTKFDRNSAQKKFEKVHPATPCYRKKQGDKPQNEQWSPDQDTAMAPGEDLAAYIVRLQNIKRLREETAAEELGGMPLQQDDLDRVEEERQREYIRTGQSAKPFGDDPGNVSTATFSGEVPPPCPPNGNSENAPVARAIKRGACTRVGEGGQTVNTHEDPIPQTAAERFEFFHGMTNQDLKQFAKELGVTLGRATQHDDMVSLLMAATDIPVED